MIHDMLNAICQQPAVTHLHGRTMMPALAVGQPQWESEAKHPIWPRMTMLRCRAMSRFNTMRMMGQLRDERWELGEHQGEETRRDGDGMVSQWATKLGHSE